MTLAQILASGEAMSPPRTRVLLTSLARAPHPHKSPTETETWSDLIDVSVASDLAERATFVAPAVPLLTSDASLHVEALRSAAIAMLWGHVAEASNRFPYLRTYLLGEWTAPPDAGAFMREFDEAFAQDELDAPRTGRRAFKTLSVETPAAGFASAPRGTLGRPSNEIIDEPLARELKPASTESRSQPRWGALLGLVLLVAAVVMYLTR